MAPTNVSSCVLSIVASFTSGIDVFKRFRETQNSKRKKRRRSQKNASVDDEETRLARSLRQGPEDIGKEYQRNIQAAGQDFAYGDGIAQTSLAEILLKLNTGLVSIINSFLAKDKTDAALDYRSLTSLSERSRVDTCRTLRQLLKRMMQLRLPKQLGSREQDTIQRQTECNPQQGRKSRTPLAPVASPRRSSKVRGPMLARVVIADSTRPSQVAMVRPGERKKKSQSSSVGSAKVQSTVSLALPPPLPSQRVDKLPELPKRPQHQRSQTVPRPEPKIRSKQSASDVGRPQPSQRGGALRATQSTSMLDHRMRIDHEPLPPVPKTASLPAIEPRRRKPTPTYYSIESTSTKLGEIPMHKWAEPYDFDAMSRLNREAEQNGWPFNNVESPQERKRRGLGIFRLFRRNRDDS